MKKALSTKQLKICNRLAEAIADERRSGWEVYPKLNRDLNENFAYKYREIESIKHIVEDERRHNFDLMKIHKRLCKSTTTV